MNYDKDLLPIEFGIIGRALLQPKDIGELAAIIRTDDFADPTARTVWDAITATFYGGGPVDAVSINLRLGGGYADILQAAKSEAVNSNVYSGPAEERARQLSETARKRRIKSKALEISLAEPDEDVTGMIDALAGMTAETAGRKVWTAAEAVGDFMDRHGSDKPPEYIKLGFYDLDDKLFLERGDMLVLGGYPSAGKTALAIQFASKIAEKYRVGFFSLETRPEKITDRLAAQISRVPLPKIKRNDLDPDDWAALVEFGKKASALQLEQIPAAGMSVADIKAYSLRQRYEVVFVDYLQLIRGYGRDRYEQVTNISQQLHTFAQAQQILVIALAQLSRPEKTNKKPAPPTMSSFRESGQIEQDADAAILLYQDNPNDYKSRRVLKLAKNKESERWQTMLDFHGEVQTFTVSSYLDELTAAQRSEPKPESDYLRRKREKAEQRAYTEAAPMFKPVAEDGPLPF